MFTGDGWHVSGKGRSILVQWGVDHADEIILKIRKAGWMTKLLTTKQVRVETDYRHFATFWYGIHSTSLYNYQNHRSDMINSSLYGKSNALKKNYIAHVSPIPRTRTRPLTRPLWRMTQLKYIYIQAQRRAAADRFRPKILGAI